MSNPIINFFHFPIKAIRKKVELSAAENEAAEKHSQDQFDSFYQSHVMQYMESKGYRFLNNGRMATDPLAWSSWM